MEQRRLFLRHVQKYSLNMVVPLDSTTWRTTPCGFQSVVDSLASLPMTLGWKNTCAQRKRSVWELVLDVQRGWGQRRQFVRHALNNLSGHGRADNTTLTYKFSRMSASHFVQILSSVVLCGS